MSNTKMSRANTKSPIAVMIDDIFVSLDKLYHGVLGHAK